MSVLGIEPQSQNPKSSVLPPFCQASGGSREKRESLDLGSAATDRRQQLCPFVKPRGQVKDSRVLLCSQDLNIVPWKQLNNPRDQLSAMLDAKGASILDSLLMIGLAYLFCSVGLDPSRLKETLSVCDNTARLCLDLFYRSLWLTRPASVSSPSKSISCDYIHPK